MMSEPIVIGVDPGSHAAGIAVVKGKKLLFTQTVDSLTDAEYNDTILAELMVEFMLSVQETIEQYEPELLVVELTSVPVNMNTNKLLAYWEACAIIAGSMSKIDIRRLRTSEGRKKGLGKNCKKHEAVMKIRHDYEDLTLSDDEAEAVVFALAGVEILNES